MLQWGDYAPDTTDYPTTLSALKERYGSGNTSQRIENVLPRGDGYGPFPSIQAYTAALPDACRGAFRAQKSDGTIQLYAGSATKLYALNNTSLTWSDVSKTAAAIMTLPGGNAIGNMTGGGNLAAAFDGTTAQAIAACASLAAVTNTAYVGQHFATAVCVRSVSIYGSNDQGYISGSNPSVTVNLYGKQGLVAPANATDGTLIGTITFTDTADEHVARTITPTDLNTLWNYIWIQPTTAASSTICVAELQMTGTVTYSLPANNQWSFTQFGSFVIAVEVGDAVQNLLLGTDNFFSNLAGSPPQAKYVSVVSEFLVLTGLVNNYNRIQWSAIGDCTGWTAGVNKSDFQDFFDGGSVLTVAGGELSAIVLQDYVTRRMTYQPGTDVVFSFDKIADDVGLLAPLSMIKQGNRIFFLGNSGFQEAVDGSVPQNIAKEKIDKAFLAEWDSTQPQLMLGFPDPLGTRVYWAYKTQSGNAGLFDKIICYDWLLQKWSRITGISGEFVTALAQAGVTLEGLDVTYPSIDAMTLSLDAFPAALGKEVSIFDSTNTLGFLRGAALEATLETSEEGNPNGQTFVNTVRPITDAPTVFAAVSSRQKISDTPVWSAESAMDAIGQCGFRVDTRHYRVRNRIPAGTTWSFTAGAEVTSVATGQR